MQDFQSFMGANDTCQSSSLPCMLNTFSIWADVTGIARKVIHKCNGILVIVGANCKYNFQEVKFSITNYNYDHKKVVIDYKLQLQLQ